MKLILLGLMILLSACDDKAKFGFTSSNCEEVQTNCLNQCAKDGRMRLDCNNSCSRSRGMCEAIKTKGCMQDCNKNHGKNSPQAEECKQRCAENRGAM